MALDLDSSDFEQLQDDADERRMLQPNGNAGKRISDAILLNQAINRPASKRNARQLTFVRGAPGTRYKLESIFATWKTFCETVDHDIDTCPSGELIFRFIDTRVKETAPVGPGKLVPSLATIVGVWRTLISLLTFRHRDLESHYTKYDVSHIHTHLDQLVMQKKLIRGRWHKKQWLGVVVIQRIARNWLERALTEGTKSWDAVLIKLLGVVLQVACSSRSGDVARTAGYTGSECLCWRHIELTLEPGAELSVQNLRGKLTLEFTKGHKDAYNEDRLVFVDPLPEGSQSAICLIKVLLIVALRLGRVYGKTLNEVLVHTAGTPNRMVQWTKPEAPVICLLGRGTDTTAHAKPAQQTCIAEALKQMALSAGVLASVNTRHIRNGSLRDTAYLGKRISGVADRCIALVAGHTVNSLNAGTTAEYIGPHQQLIYNLRAEAPFKDRLAPSFAAEWYVQLKVKSRELDEHMAEQGLDKDDTRERRKAGDRLRDEHVEEWRTTGVGRVVDKAPAKETYGANKPGAQKPGAKNALATRTPSQINSDQGRRATHPIDPAKGPEEYLPTDRDRLITTPVNSPGAPPEKYFSESTPTSATTSEQTPQIAIDPRLLDDETAAAIAGHTVDSEGVEVDAAALNSLGDIIFPTPDDRSDEAATGDFADKAMIESALTNYTPPPDRAAASLAADDFVDTFSKINFYKLFRPFDRSDPDTVAKHVRVGNSRDAPTSWLFYCSKGTCEFSNPFPNIVAMHETSCKGIQEAGEVPCPYEGCDAEFGTELLLKEHIDRMHKWVPQSCVLCPDKPDVLYYSSTELSIHRAKKHANLDEPMQCPLFAKCKNKEQFDGKRQLKGHLKRVHLLTNEEIEGYIPHKKIVRRKRPPTVCPEDDCGRKGTFTKEAHLRSHLMLKHKMSKAQAEAKVPLTASGATRRRNTEMAKAERKRARPGSPETEGPLSRKRSRLASPEGDYTDAED